MKRQTGLLVCSILLVVSAGAANTTETRYFRGALSPANESPAVTGVTASGQGTITIYIVRNDAGGIVSATVYFDVDYDFALPASVSGLHIHTGAVGVNGPIVIDAIRTGTVNAQGQGNIYRVGVFRNAANTAALVTDILANPGNYYLNLHTTVNGGGLMRDQLQAIPQPDPVVSENGVMNNASLAPGTNPVAPGSVAVVRGKYLNDGSTTAATSFGPDGKLPTTLAGTQVTLNGIAAPIFYSTFTELAIQIPSELAGQSSANLQVSVAGKPSVSSSVALAAAAPGIFTTNLAGTGAALMLHQDGATLVTSTNPAQANEVVTLFGTGFGATSSSVATGAPSAGDRLETTPTATIDGVSATVEFAGRAAGSVGVDRLELRVPTTVHNGSDLGLVVTAGGRQSNTVTTAVTGASGTAINPLPVITSLSPNTAYVGDPPIIVAINGTGFMPTSTVLVNNVQRSAVFVQDTQLTINLTAGELAIQQSISIRVQNPAPGGGNSNTTSFSVVPEPVKDPYDY
ncbi:MAG: CHRD domain-containing protein [Acidobacteria bacterium]|nr:CHRD domain-containing protein [Acidobacteriota bacterium]